MPPYIEGYQSQDQAEAPGSFSTSLPEVVDIGPKLNQVAGTITSIAAPIVAEKEKQQAIDDAGSATIVKTPEGGYARSAAPKGLHSLTYARAFSDAMDERQLNLMSEDYATQLSLVAQKWVDDPEQRDPRKFATFAAGLADGMMQAAPAGVKLKLDGQLVREQAQSVRGFAESTMKVQHQQLADGLRQDYSNKVKEIGKLAVSNGDPNDVAKQINVLTTEAVDTLGKLKGIGEIGDTAPYVEGLAADTFDEKLLVQSAQSMQGLGANLHGLSDEELRRLQYWGTYQTDDGGTVGKMKFSDFRTLFPSMQVAHQAGAVAGDVLNGRISAANQQAMLEAMKQQGPDTVSVVESDIENQNYAPSSGLTHQQVAEANLEYAKNGPVADQLRSPDGKIKTLQYLARVGATPIGTDKALRSLVLSSDPAAQQSAFDFIWNARDVTTGAAWTGLNWFNNLPDDVRALAQFDATMRRAGFNTTMELRTILAKNQGRLLGHNEVVSMFGRESDYDQAVLGTMAKEYGVKAGELGPAGPQMKADFDRYMTINANLYATKEQAMEASAAMLSTGWKLSPVFLGGVGDAKLVNEGIPTWFMDEVLKQTPTLRSGNPAGASFSNGRVRIQAMGESPTKGYPYYQFTYFNDRGQMLGRGAVYPMQRIVDTWHAYVSKTKAKEQADALDAMRPPTWVLGHDPRNGGKLRYIDNSAAVNEWQKRQAKKPGNFSDAAKQRAIAATMQNRY